MRGYRHLVAVAAGSVLLLASLAAQAEKYAPLAKPPAPVITITGTPMFGVDSTSGAGWSDVVARVDNLSAVTQKGTIELSSSSSYGREDQFSARAPFSVPAGQTALLTLPIHTSSSYSPSVELLAIGEHGDRLGSTTVTSSNAPAPLLVEIAQPARVGLAMRGASVPTPWSPGGGPTYYGTPTAGRTPLTVGSPQFDRTTGDPVLPDRAAGYSSVTVLLVASDVLARLEASRLDALESWVLAGGTLAVVPTRPEDLRGAVLTGLVGGEVTRAPAPPVLFTLPTFLPPDPLAPPIPAPPSSGGGSAPTPDVPMRFVPGPGPLTLVPAIKPTAQQQQQPGVAVGPTSTVRAKLSGWTGGNLRETAFGATAGYGLGQVHLLAFDPSSQDLLGDAWTHTRLVELVAAAWDRHAQIAFPHASGERNAYRTDQIRRSLDPNENFRAGLGISAILLVIYSILVGPVIFYRATKRGRPLQPLVWAPIVSAIAFATIVVVGLAGKGWRGRARHLSLAEAGVGTSHATIRRFRGFFASETRTLSVRATDRTCVLDVAIADSSTRENALLQLDRDGVSLQNMTSLPWQTAVVREDGIVDVGGTVSVLRADDGTVTVVNRTGRLLKDVFVWEPHSHVAYFPELKNGDRVRSRDGKDVLSASMRTATTSGTKSVNRLGARELGTAITGRYSDRFATTWSAIEDGAGEVVDWWPDDTPVVLAEIAQGEKTTNDSGLALESDRLLFRVVGQGGAP